MRAFNPLLFRLYASDLELAILGLSREYQMGLKLQGLAEKMKKLEHDAEFEAARLDARIEGEAARLPTVFSGAHAHLDGIQKNIGDVASSFDAIQAVTNGAPPLDDEPAVQSASLNGSDQPIEQGIGPTHVMPANP